MTNRYYVENKTRSPLQILEDSGKGSVRHHGQDCSYLKREVPEGN